MSMQKIVIMKTDTRLLSGMNFRQQAEYLSVKARDAASLSAELSGFGPFSSFPKNNEGAPESVNGLYWGVSHKTEIVAGSVSGRPVGIDVEVFRDVSDRLLARVSTDTERAMFYAYCGQESCNIFFRIWTAKEAVLKYSGAGLSGLGSCRIRKVLSASYLTVEYQDSDYPVCLFVSGDYIVSAVSSPEKVDFIYEPDVI